MLAGHDRSSRIVYNAARQHFAIEQVILEDARTLDLFTRRIRKLGVTAVAGQLLFKFLVEPCLAFEARARIREIEREFGFDESQIDPTRVIRVASVNSERTEMLLQRLTPDVVIVNGTRIISKRILTCVPAPFVNMHAGITPLYRGSHGAYWALVQRNPEACGVTVHVVDAGIDTGKILGQAVIRPTGSDNFVTYPLLQLGAGLPLFISAVAQALDGYIESTAGPAGPSRLWFHPTAFGYLYCRVAKGVR